MKLDPTVKDLSKAQYENMENSVETLTNTFRQRGVLTEADIDGEDIVVLSEDTRNPRKDERVLYQQRAVYM
jgi:prophage tail gpP-like protein